MTKVYYEVLPATLGRAMYRIRNALLSRKPPEVTVVVDPESADLQVVDVIGTGALRHFRNDNLVMLMHTWRTAGDPAFWKSIWDRARLVVSYHELPLDRYLRMPWGVDEAVFVPPKRREVKIGMLTTGYDARQEAILEPIEASNRFGWPGAHVGGRVKELEGLRASRYENISDENLVQLYQQSAWVAAMRYVEGFELPALEGLLCGARPIMFDQPGVRYWYEDHDETAHAVFVPELRGPALVEALVAAMGKGPAPVLEAERARIVELFSWDRWAPEFWEAVLS